MFLELFKKSSIRTTYIKNGASQRIYFIAFLSLYFVTSNLIFHADFRFNERILIRKLDKMVCIPTVSKMVPGIAIRMETDGFKGPKESDSQYSNAKIYFTGPATTSNKPIMIPCSRLIFSIWRNM